MGSPGREDPFLNENRQFTKNSIDFQNSKVDDRNQCACRHSAKSTSEREHQEVFTLW